MTAPATPSNAGSPNVGEAVKRAVSQLRQWEHETPIYAGADPRAVYYRQRRETIRLAILALTASQPRCEQGAVERLREVFPDREDIARVLFDQRQTSHDFDDAADADPESDAGTLRSIVFDDADAILALSTPVASEPAIPAGSPTVPAIPVDESSIPDEQVNDALRHGFGDRIADEVIAASPAYTQRAVDRGFGWIVLSGDGKRYRTWKDGWSAWTDDREQATRYARREDAEAVHGEDEDAWLVEAYTPRPVEGETGEGWTASVKLAETLHRLHYGPITTWRPLPTIAGVISQIDNMTAGLARPVEAGAGKLAEVEPDIEMIEYLAKNDCYTRSFRQSLAGAAKRIRAALTTPAGGIAEGRR